MRRDTNSAPAFPDIEAQLGYNPARFLVPTAAELDELSWQTRAQAFIRGMDEIETIRAWQRVEVALGEGPNGGPRQTVIAWLNQRQAVLDGTAPTDEHGVTAATVAADTTAPTPETSGDPDDPSPAGATTHTTTHTTTDTSIAADGGTMPDETPLCPHCQAELTREEIAGQIGYWCPQCRDFREPGAPAEVDA